MPKATPVFQDIKATLIEANEQRTVTNDQVMELNQTFKDMYDMEKGAQLDALEASREASAAIGGQQAGLQQAAQGLADDTEKKSGGFLSKLLGGGLMVAAGAALAAVVAGILAIMKMDVDGIIEKVKKLFSISDMAESVGDALTKGGKFFIIMTALGAGLMVFGVGSAVAGAADKFIDMDVESIKQSVLQLLSIGPAAEADGKSFIGEGAKFLLAMTGLGMGLAIFGVGSAIAGMSDKLLDKFNGDFATSIKNNVLTLLSIGSDVEANGGSFIGEGAKFLGAMLGIGLGLAVFGAGSAVAGMSDAVLDYFNSDFATSIKNNVLILLSIGPAVEELSGGTFIGESAKFLGAMLGLSAGLVAFAGGQAFAGIVDFFVGDQATKMKNSVITLISITDGMGDDPVYKANQFKTSMTVIGEGLSNFAGGKFMSALKDAGTAVLGFFGLGTESPFDAIMGVARNADALNKGADAVERLAFALEKIAPLNFTGNVAGQLQALAKDLMMAVAPLEMAINGGTLPKSQAARLGLGRKDYVFKGLSSPELKIDEAVTTVNKVRQMISTMLGEAQTEVANANSQSSAASGGGSVTTNNISNGGAATMIVPQSSPFNMNETATILR
jgi:hypothetical protein